MKEPSYCYCSSYGDEKVNFAQCVIDRGGYPCYYVLMPESRWYTEKFNVIFKIEYKLRGIIWMTLRLYFQQKKKGGKIK